MGLSDTLPRSTENVGKDNQQMQSPPVNIVMRFSVLCILGTWAIAFFSARLMSADGAFYIARIAEEQSYFIVGWHRVHAQILTQWLPVLIAYLWKPSLELITTLYAVNLFVVGAAGVLLTAYWMRQRPSLLSLPILSFILLELNSTAIIMGEHHMLALISWAILAFILNPVRNIVQRTLFLFLCIIAIRLYEAAAIVLLLPFLLCLWSAKREWSRRGEAIFWIIAAAILLAGVAISIHGILSPRDPLNYVSFQQQVFVALGSPLAQACLIMTGATLLALRKGDYIPLATGLALSGAVVFVHWMNGSYVTALQSFSARTFSISVLPLLMLAAWGYSWLNLGNGFSRVSALWFCVFIVGACGYVLIGEAEWKRLIHRIDVALQNGTGFIKPEEAGIDLNNIVGHFALPTMGVLLSDHCVRTILVLPETYWQPYDLREEKILNRYREYSSSVHGSGCRQ